MARKRAGAVTRNRKVGKMLGADYSSSEGVKEGHMIGIAARLAVVTLASGFSLTTVTAATAQPLTCRSTANRLTAVNLPGNHNVTTRFQLDTPNLEVLMQTPVTVSGSGPSCLVADLSALTRITDNYVVFQVRVDGVPMEGHQGGYFGVPDPVVPVLFDDEDEQFVDPYRILSYSFFKQVSPGRHLVEVMVAGGSNIAPGFEPQVISPVLTLHYR